MGRIEGGRWGWVGRGGVEGAIVETTVLEQQLKKEKERVYGQEETLGNYTLK